MTCRKCRIRQGNIPGVWVLNREEKIGTYVRDSFHILTLGSPPLWVLVAPGRGHDFKNGGLGSMCNWKMVSDTIFFLTTGVSNVELEEWNSAWLLMLLRAGSCREGLTKELGTSLMIQWLRCHVSNAGGADSIPGWGARIPQASWPRKPKKHKIEAML